MTNVEERNAIIEKYMPLAKSMAWNKWRSLPSIALDEFISAAYDGLVDAAVKFEWSKGEFGPYAKFRINGEIIDYLRSLGFGSKSSVSRGCTRLQSLEACQERGEIAFVDATASMPLEIVFEEMVESLGETGRKILRLHLVDGYQVSEISRSLGVSVSRVSQMISKYKRQLVAEAA